MKRKLIASLLALVLSLNLAACAGGTPASSAPAASNTPTSGTPANAGEPTNLNIWVAGTGDPKSDKAFRTVCDAYVAANPSVSYELTFIAWKDYFTKLNTALAGGAGPDILMLGYGQMGTVQSMDTLLQLDEYIPKDWDGWNDFLPNVLNAGKNDGKLYGMLMPQTRVYYYRKDIAAQQGVTAEDLKVDSYEELRALSIKMTVKDAGGKIKMSGNALVTGSTSAEQQFASYMNVLTDNPVLWNDDLTPNFNSADGIKTMETLVALYKEGVSLPSQPSALVPGIVDGTAAMSGGSEFDFIQADAAFPGQISILDCSLGSMLSGNYFAINKATKHPQASVDMLLHMFSKESCLTFSQQMGLYSGRTSLDEEYIKLNPEEFPKSVRVFAKAKAMGNVMNPNFNKMLALFRTASEEIFAGADPAQRLQQAADEYTAAIKK